MELFFQESFSGNQQVLINSTKQTKFELKSLFQNFVSIFPIINQ